MVQINMEMPLDCNRCRFSSKNGMDYKCIVDGNDLHPSWIERSLENPMRPCNCPLTLKEVPAGKWIPDREYNDDPTHHGWERYICSECGKAVIIETDEDNIFEEYSKCPNCEVKMSR